MVLQDKMPLGELNDGVQSEHGAMCSSSSGLLGLENSLGNESYTVQMERIWRAAKSPEYSAD
jgi:hypothetical protein